MRLSITSLNLWNTEHLAARLDCIKAFLNTFNSDIFCFQEIRPSLISFMDPILSKYNRIEDEDEGWNNESNIYFNKEKFDLISYERFPLNMPEIYRGLFIVKLKIKTSGKEFFVITVHFTHQGNSDELRTGVPYRHMEAKLAAGKITQLTSSYPVILTGDFNDPIHPSYILQTEAGMKDLFSSLCIPAPVTFPCPYLSDENYLVEAIDKIMYKNCTPLMATSPHFHIPGGVLSDHWPVMGMFEL